MSLHGVKHKIGAAHNRYLEDILGLNCQSEEDINKSDFSRKKIFSLLKNSRTNIKSVSK